jgi:hypothetical protein
MRFCYPSGLQQVATIPRISNFAAAYRTYFTFFESGVTGLLITARAAMREIQCPVSVYQDLSLRRRRRLLEALIRPNFSFGECVNATDLSSPGDHDF